MIKYDKNFANNIQDNQEVQQMKLKINKSIWISGENENGFYHC